MTFGILDLIVNVSVIFGEYIDLRIFSFKNHQKITFILIHSFSKKRLNPIIPVNIKRTSAINCNFESYRFTI